MEIMIQNMNNKKESTQPPKLASWKFQALFSLLVHSYKWAQGIFWWIINDDSSWKLLDDNFTLSRCSIFLLSFTKISWWFDNHTLYALPHPSPSPPGGVSPYSDRNRFLEIPFYNNWTLDRTQASEASQVNFTVRRWLMDKATPQYLIIIEKAVNQC